MEGDEGMEKEYYSKGQEIINFDFKESKYMKEHFHKNVEIFYVLEGEVQLKIETSWFLLKKDDFVVINSYEKHQYRAKKTIFLAIIHINYERLSPYIDLEQNFFRCNSVTDKNENYQKIRKISNQIFQLYFYKEEEGIYLNSLYYSLIALLVKNFICKKDIDSYDAKISEESRIRKIVDYINTNYRNPLSLNELAGHLFLSTAYLSKYIKKKLNTNFTDYITQVRMEYAIEDMCKNQKSITRVSLDNGFPNTNAFTTAFKKKYGVTPSVWLKEHKDDWKEIRKRVKKEKIDKEKHIRAFLEQKPLKEEIIERQSKHTIIANGKEGILYKKSFWNKMINIGSITNLLLSGIQEHLIVLRKELEFQYVRFWDIFTEDMLIQLHRGKQNFSKIDRAIDFLIEHGMRPFIELGFKPVYLTRTVDNVIVAEEREIIFKSYQDYADMLYLLLAHWVNRYGLEEVEKWYFEQWGDPRITSGDTYGEYFEVFETAYYTLKSVSSKIKIGGAGFGRLYSTLDFRGIIDLWKKRMCYPDFISLYSYPYMARSNNKCQNDDRIQDSNFINNQVLMMKEVLEEASMHIPELIITEWSSSVSDWNSLNDSVYKGAFILKSIIDNIDSLDLMGYWWATDILSEFFDTGMLLRGGNGLLTVNGIKKPAFYAIQFVNRLGKLLINKNKYSVVTTNGNGNYFIVCHNYITPNFHYYLKEEDEIDVRKQHLLFDKAETLELDFHIKNVKNGKYLVKIHSLNSTHGSVQDQWGELGYIEHLNLHDIEYLDRISTPKVTATEFNVKDGVLRVDTQLLPHEIQAIHLTYQIEFK